MTDRLQEIKAKCDAPSWGRGVPCHDDVRFLIARVEELERQLTGRRSVRRSGPARRRAPTCPSTSPPRSGRSAMSSPLSPEGKRIRRRKS
jgi:hypothetical protein